MYTRMQNHITGMQIGSDQTITFANNALINTQNTIDFVAVETPVKEYLVEVCNLSTVTDLTVKICTTAVSLGASTTRYCLLAQLAVPKSQAITGTTVNAYAFRISGAFVREALRLVVSNDTALGAAEGFLAYLRIREVN